jgi:hypothetical protein
MEENARKKSWWIRNWKWALPTGGCLLFIGLFIALIGGAVYGVSNLLTDSQASRDGLKKASQNEKVLLLLGTPIEVKGIPSGNVNYTDGIKTAELSIPIQGPKSKATLRVDGTAQEDIWTYSTMKVIIDDSDKVIDLLEKKLID